MLENEEKNKVIFMNLAKTKSETPSQQVQPQVFNKAAANILPQPTKYDSQSNISAPLFKTLKEDTKRGSRRRAYSDPKITPDSDPEPCQAQEEKRKRDLKALQKQAVVNSRLDESPQLPQQLNPNNFKDLLRKNLAANY